MVLKEGAYLRLDIQDFNLTEVRQFIVNWLTAVETHLHEDSNHWRTQAKIAAEDLFQRIDENPTLSDLAVNPLMLQIIALVHRDRGTLPDRRVELYKECTDVLLERWDKAKGLQVLLSAPQARQLLQPVALWMHSVENRREVSKAEVLDFIKPRIPPIKAGVDPEELLKSWRERNGIFKGEGDTYFFHHLSFQEYLTAEEIRNTGKVDILVKNFDHAWWREPTLLAMGLTNPPIFANFIEALLWANWRDGARVAFMLQCIDETLVKDESPFLKALRRLRRSEARLNALRGLQRIHSTQKEVKTVVKSVFEKDEDLFVRELARDLLAEWGEAPAPEAAETLTVIVRGKTRQLPPRINNLRELNAEYILIPGGKYRYSVTKEEVEVPPLYFAKYPLTNKLYRRFIDYLAEKETMREALHALPRQQFAASLLKKAEETKDFIEYLGSDPARWAEKLKSRYENEKRFNGGDQPVVAVTWFAATAYCLWLTELGKTRSEERGAKSEKLNYRLPQEEEWEWAAGGGKREYPWGNEPPDDTRANYGEKVGQTTPVGAYPARTTPEGLMDMAGNVWEWMENPYGVKEYPEARALRGGSWFSVDPVLRCSARSLRRPGSYWGYSGFRVVGCQS